MDESQITSQPEVQPSAPVIQNFTEEPITPTPNNSKRTGVVIVVLVLIASAGYFLYSRKDSGILNSAVTVTAAPTEWQTVGTRVGTMKHPSENLKFAITAKSGGGALLLYTDGRTASLSDRNETLNDTDEVGVGGKLLGSKTASVVMQGNSWNIREKLVQGSSDSSTSYRATGKVIVGGVTYSLVYEQAEEGVLLGGKPLTETAITEARNTFYGLLAGVAFN